ncbi:M15 family metallopeptidase [Krasilnikovia sp. MM14-A1259]|uniref:M15 family metallopeptidase n=1 Tax=Krasilnikovia sp. MM14-A1259 TaxID=3373539 RepID=UPI00381E9013
MSTSQNGWPVDSDGSHEDRAPIYGDVRVPNGIRAGDVATVLRWAAQRYHETVEPLVPGTCWGWFVKPIEGTRIVSNHASGTAIDLNADKHPMGVAAARTMTAKQIAACRAIVRASGGVVRWGGDYTGRPDPMHWEIVGSPAATAALATKLRTPAVQPVQEDDMPTAAEIADAVWNHPLNIQTDPKKPADNQPAGGILRYTSSEHHRMIDGVAAVAAAVTKVAARQLTPEALTAALTAAAPAIAGAVVTALPDGADISAVELQEAIVGALRELAAA